MADYKNTVFLPKTAFPMKGGLATKEPELLAFWRDIKLGEKQREQNKDRKKFILHDGPPYANGNIHIGHAVNKILKDVVNRCQQMLGKATHYVPGWDCHGLPIEWKIEEKYREKKQNKDSVPVLQFREECRAFAAHWKDVQAAEFQRLGVSGDWENPYTTMTKGAEAQIVREIHKFAGNGGLYRDVKPVLWSIAEKTALADAEVEYHDHTSTTLYVAFPVIKGALKDASVVIWTTTPWTLPSNRAISYGKEIAYCLIEAGGKKFVVAEALLEKFCQDANITEHKILQKVDVSALAHTVCAHPLRGQGYEFDVPLLAGDFVTTEQGTGFVHIAPSHGEDDYRLGRAHKIEIPDYVDDEGRYRASVPLFAGKLIYKPNGKEGDANAVVIEALEKIGAILGQKKLVHSYPHSWRSKAPLIFRVTPQWFISMEKNDLRDKALRAIEETKWFPAIGENRIRAMIETRPDWCISRQRSWGVPIAIFVSKKDNSILRDEEVFKRVADAFEQDGADAWFARDPQEFLGSKYKAADFDQIKDIVDVWFESGSTHAFVLPALLDKHETQADLYLEGSDQHRGWFHSSLLEACGTKGKAPYKAVLTHGFVLDEQGRKMSKSLGNVVAPQEVTEKMGADILRLWVIGSDYTEDLKVGPEILKQYAETYRRLRNTLRYLLGALEGYSEAEHVELKDMPELERVVLHRVATLDHELRHCIEQHNYSRLVTELHNFCAVELSAFYFDMRKDSLYCDRPDSVKRRAARTVMNTLFNWLTAWLAPVLCFTAEEAWQARLAEGGKGEASIHLRTLPQAHKDWRNDHLADKWQAIRDVRRVVTGALERARNEKTIGSSLQAAPVVQVTNDTAKLLAETDFAEVCITSAIHVVKDKEASGFSLPDVAGVSVAVELAKGEKCERCWKVLEEVGKDPAHPTLCKRCAEAVGQMDKAA
jgi:isoleucyl-tRNA synthetase